MRLSTDLNQEEAIKWEDYQPSWGLGNKIVRYLINAALWKNSNPDKHLEVPTLAEMTNNKFEFVPPKEENDD